MDEIIILDTENVKYPEYDIERDSLYQIREKSVQESEVEVSIYVQAYNRLEKTKRCVEVLLENTEEDYELILVDNGSEDGTLEYFKSIKHPRKKIVRVTKNVGSGYPVSYAMSLCSGRYIVTIANDVYVTKYWLRNMLNCMKSDERIGMVAPRSTNVSNCQMVDSYQFKNIETFMKDAELYNKISDPSKWEERLRLITIAPMYRKSTLNLVGPTDNIFVHDFGEDDVCARMRLAGYKMILSGDTFVHHDHNVFAGEEKDMNEFKKLLQQGRMAFKEKHQGLDAWDDILNFEYTMLQHFNLPISEIPNMLGIDVKCGHPILTLSNNLRKNAFFRNTRYAFTTKAKYYRDLQFVCGAENVQCDRVEYMDEYYEVASMDYVVLGEPINTYNEPGSIFCTIMKILKPGGTLYFKLRNTVNIKTYLNLIGCLNIIDEDLPTQISMEEMLDTVKAFRPREIKLSMELVDDIKVSQEMYKSIAEKLTNGENLQSVFNKLVTKNYCFCIKT